VTRRRLYVGGRPARVRRRRRRHGALGFLVALLALVVVVGVGGPVALGWRLTHPPRVPVTTTPAAWGLAYSDVRFMSRVDRVPLSGWWIPGPPGGDLTVVVAHGYGQNRLVASVPGSAVIRALHAMGASVFAFDFRGEGESGGHLVSIGEFEVRDLLGAVDWVSTHHPARARRVVLLGYSMGATVALMAGEADPRVAGVIADSPFAALGPYLRANLPVWTHLPKVPFDAIILAIVPRITGLDPARVDPLAHMRAFGGRPVLLIAGRADRVVPDGQSEELARAAAPGGRVTLWLVPGAGHIAALRTAPTAYLAHLYAFLRMVDPAIRRPPAPSAVGLGTGA
jgi:alpha-beta hydrolase superfamily lysophospholipase